MLKSVFCVDFTGLYCLAFEQNYGKAQLDRHRLSATKLYARDSSCQRYISCADIRRLRCANSDKNCVLLRATAGTAIARLSHRNSVRPSVRVSHGWIWQKRCKLGSSNLHRRAAPRTLISGSVTLSLKFHRGHPNRGP